MSLVALVFSKNGKYGSKLIREMSASKGEDIDKIPSHVAWLFFNIFVLESAVPFGFRISWYPYFKEKNSIVKRLNLIKELTHREARIMMEEILKSYYGKGYDYLGVLYQGYRILLFKLFKVSIPDDNKWEKTDKISCQEALEKILGKPLKMVTPYNLMLKLSEESDFIEGGA